MIKKYSILCTLIFSIFAFVCDAKCRDNDRDYPSDPWKCEDYSPWEPADNIPSPLKE